MNKPYDLIVFIGRFQPVHNAHVQTLKKASSLADNVLVLIGSKNSPRTPKNPWTYEERACMIQSIKFQSTKATISVAGIKDHTYDDNAWISEVGELVAARIDKIGGPLKVGIIGHDKDHSSFYLNYFPQWDFIDTPIFPAHGASIDATKIRRLMFEQDFAFVTSVIPVSVNDMLSNHDVYETPFLMSSAFKLLQKEYDYITAYKQSWASAPYAPTFITADAVVIQSGHILLIKRGGFPGNGLWALPGGFVDQNEKIRDTVVRELREETGLRLPTKVLDRAIDAYDMFDDPGRSSRGRTVTHTYRITLDPTQALPKVRGGDDASNAEWIPLSDLGGMENVLFEDHFHIIKHLLAQPARVVR